MNSRIREDQEADSRHGERAVQEAVSGKEKRCAVSDQRMEKSAMHGHCEGDYVSLDENTEAHAKSDQNLEHMEDGSVENGSQNVRDSGRKTPGSAYLIACDARERERRKELLYNVLSPVFFGEREAANGAELAELFRVRYGIDVGQDFYEGDDHYEEYQEARQAIAEGMDIYGGEIAFDDGVLAELAERVWKLMEEKDRAGFRRINTMLEE